jgi:TonB family protein
MDRIIPQHLLLRFLAISVALHLFLLVEFKHSLLVVPDLHLGQSVLDIHLQGNARSPAPIPSSETETKSPSTKISGTDATAMPADIAHSSPSVPAADIEPRVPVPTAGTESGLHNQLLGVLKTRLSYYLTYPPLARSHGWEGTVLLGLRIESDGRLEKVHVERGSGYAVLDHSALNSLKRLGRLTEASAWLEGRSLDMQLPVIYRLIEN